jgi:hypothetical protein
MLVPPPLPLHGAEVAAETVLSAASFLLEAARDEIDHLRPFCRQVPQMVKSPTPDIAALALYLMNTTRQSFT